MSQTIGSASSSVASGIDLHDPRAVPVGPRPAVLQMALLALAGGLLGMLHDPAAAAADREEHGELPYPEGTACAEVLTPARPAAPIAGVFFGLGVGAPSRPSPAAADLPRRASRPTCRSCARASWPEIAPALLGVGYILGYRASRDHGRRQPDLVAGAHSAHRDWGAALTTPFFPETELTITEMSAGADLVALRPLHRRGRGGGGRHHDADPQHPDDDRELPGGRSARCGGVPATAGPLRSEVEGRERRATCRSRSPSPALLPSS